MLRVFEHLFSRIQKASFLIYWFWMPNFSCPKYIYELTFHYCLQEKEVRKEEKLRFTCKCSFLEIYNEQILDLLNPNAVNLHVIIWTTYLSFLLFMFLQFRGSIMSISFFFAPWSLHFLPCIFSKVLAGRLKYFDIYIIIGPEPEWLVFLLQIREDAKKGVHVENLTEPEVSNAREAMQQLNEVKLIKVVASFFIDTFSWSLFFHSDCNIYYSYFITLQLKLSLQISLLVP
jgi:hypothetical protein